MSALAFIIYLSFVHKSLTRSIPLEGAEVLLYTFLYKVYNRKKFVPVWTYGRGAPPLVFETSSPAQTEAVGEKLARAVPGGALILFRGGLGAGKTTFCRGLARGLGCTDAVSSPTFAIVNVYRGPRTFAHFDLYRTHTEEDLLAAGFYDYLDAGAVVAAEWSENAGALLEKEKAVRVFIETLGENERRITIEGAAL